MPGPAPARHPPQVPGGEMRSGTLKAGAGPPGIELGQAPVESSGAYRPGRVARCRPGDADHAGACRRRTHRRQAAALVAARPLTTDTVAGLLVLLITVLVGTSCSPGGRPAHAALRSPHRPPSWRHRPPSWRTGRPLDALHAKKGRFTLDRRGVAAAALKRTFLHDRRQAHDHDHTASGTGGERRRLRARRPRTRRSGNSRTSGPRGKHAPCAMVAAAWLRMRR